MILWIGVKAKYDCVHDNAEINTDREEVAFTDYHKHSIDAQARTAVIHVFLFIIEGGLCITC